MLEWEAHKWSALIKKIKRWTKGYGREKAETVGKGAETREALALTA